MKKAIALLLAFCLACSFLSALAENEDPLARFAVRNGSRAEKRIAITVDDAFDVTYVWKIRDLFKELGVVGTFFPIGKMLREKDREEWQKVVEYGNEIGSHNSGHYKMGNSNPWNILSSLGRFQHQLDLVLGYHYQVQSFRPPYGNITDENGSERTFRHAVNLFGYEHVILWDISQTDPEKALEKVRNGSILLYHSRNRDYKCLAVLIPQLLEQGYELVTVSDLLGFGEIQTGKELYVYRKEDYQNR